MKRSAIQKALAPKLKAAVEATAKELNLDLSGKSPELRRLYRALVAEAAGMLLDKQAPPPLLVLEATRAVAQEVEGRANIAAALGNPFGLPPPASA